MIHRMLNLYHSAYRTIWQCHNGLGISFLLRIESNQVNFMECTHVINHGKQMEWYHAANDYVIIINNDQWWMRWMRIFPTFFSHVSSIVNGHWLLSYVIVAYSRGIRGDSSSDNNISTSFFKCRNVSNYYRCFVLTIGTNITLSDTLIILKWYVDSTCITYKIEKK